MDPHDIDFAALRVLRTVRDQGSFTRAAEVLGTSQSAVSYTVDRLRRVFGDPLFVRQGAGIVPTGRCDEITATAVRLLDEFAALSEPRAFDPATAEAVVTLGCNYYERVTLLPPLLRLLRAEAPGLALRIVASMVRGREQLVRGESDMLIGPIRIDGAGFHARPLLRDHYVCVMDPANPLARDEMGAARFAAAPQAVVNFGAGWRSAWLVEMEAARLSPRMAVEVPSHASMPQLILGTDLIATVPARVAQSYGAGLAQRACPFRGEFGIDLYWTGRTQHSPLHRWLRQRLAQIAATL